MAALGRGQLLLVEQGLQVGVHLVGVRLAFVLHGAGGGQLGGGGVWAEQVAQVQRVGRHRCAVDLQRRLRHAVGGVQVEHHRLGTGWAVGLDEPWLVAMGYKRQRFSLYKASYRRL